MKKLIIILSFIAISCGSDDNINSNCNFLFDAGVNLTVNTNLPQFNQLQFNTNAVYVANQGNNGIWLYRLNSSTSTLLQFFKRKMNAFTFPHRNSFGPMELYAFRKKKM